ncbi:hypothetical protein PG988_011556 [Apiospora saccharicola]
MTKGRLGVKVAGYGNIIDIISDLGFSSPFGCLEGRSYHLWVWRITKTIRFGGVVNVPMSVGWAAPVVRNP